MAYEKKDGDISLFENKKTNDRQPDWKGELLLNGVTYDVALWSRRGGTILSGMAKVNETIKRDKETHDLIAGAAYLAAREQEPLYKVAEKMNEEPEPEPVPDTPSMFVESTEEEDLPF